MPGWRRNGLAGEPDLRASLLESVDVPWMEDLLEDHSQFVDMMLLGSLSDRVSVPDVEELEQVLAWLCL